MTGSSGLTPCPACGGQTCDGCPICCCAHADHLEAWHGLPCPECPDRRLRLITGDKTTPPGENT